jgi:glycosyltransferase involved in cell wall biosynthesis
MTLRVGYLISHPIQYLTPLFRELAERCDLTVHFAHRQTAEQQSRAGFGVAFEWDIDLLSGYRSEFLTNVARNPWPDNFWGCNTPEISDRIARGRFDAFVVPGWALRSYTQAVMACRRNGVPVFVRGDSQLVGQRKGPIRLAKELVFSRMLRAFDGFLYVGKRNREYLRYYDVPEDRLFFSPHCVDNGAFRLGAEQARSQGVANGGERGAARRILFVGKLHPRKNPMDVLRAAEIVRRNGIAVEVVYAGSGELADSLDAFAKSVGLVAHFHGFVNQTVLPGIYAAADVIVLPSSGAETWGLVINEAMACGVPAVVSDAVGCGPDLVESGITGAIFPLGDVAALARAIETVLRLDGASTRTRVESKIERYSPAVAAAGILDGVERLRSQLLPKPLKQRKD